MERYILGLDFGTDSVRTVVVNADSGKEEAGNVVDYSRWAEGLYSDPANNQFRQHPLDYIESMEASVRCAIAGMGESAAQKVMAVGIDTTGSTPCAVDREGNPLSMKDEFKGNPNAMFIIWKDHTAVREAEEINRTARSWGGIDFTMYEGGIYSSEWFWAKLLHVLREDEKVREAAFSWVEHCDWMHALLTGNTDPLTLKRSRCAAGHKAMWHAGWGGLPPEEFLRRIDPLLSGWGDRLFTETWTSDTRAGGLTEEWAERLGLKPGIAVAVGAFDAHLGAVGGGISPGVMVKIMGTSTCDMIVAPEDALGEKKVAGICGQVDGSVIPGMVGLEAGQSGFGDVFAWFAGLLAWPLQNVKTSSIDADSSRKLKEEIRKKTLAALDREAAALSIDDTGLLALDWLNGRRTPDADQNLKGAVIGLTLGATAAKVHRALVESTAFGSKATMDRFINEGIPVDEVIAMGGISKNSPFVMQVTADVLNMPIKIAASEQTCALGAAMFGAAAAGLYQNVEEAQEHMGSGFSETYYPNRENAARYAKLYPEYIKLGRRLEFQLRSL
jgi:L-ribulokinase